MNGTGRVLLSIVIIMLVIAGAYVLYGYFGNDISYSPDNTPGDNASINTGNNPPLTSDDEWGVALNPDYSFRYPREIDTDYVDATDWPPSVQLTVDDFTCTEGGEATANAGETRSITVDGREYCRTIVIEGAAGSTYTQYAYAFLHEGSMAIMTFSTRMPQCDNYDGDESEACQVEQDDFNADTLADQMIDTFKTAE